jgi:hypothetical protein
MKYLIIILLLFSTQVFSDNKVKSYTANTIVRYTGTDDVLPYGYQLALRCGDIPITINLSINKNIVNGKVINNYSEFNNYISDKECTSFHSGKLNGKFDKRGKF